MRLLSPNGIYLVQGSQKSLTTKSDSKNLNNSVTGGSHLLQVSKNDLKPNRKSICEEIEHDSFSLLPQGIDMASKNITSDEAITAL